MQRERWREVEELFESAVSRPPEERAVFLDRACGEDEELRPDDYPDVEALRAHWDRDEAAMRAWLETLTDEDVAAPVSSELSRDSRPLWQYVLHIVIHGTQQQADAATLLTIAGRSPGELGWLEFLRETGA